MRPSGKKSTTADNTGNRDTAGCEGCPYLLPWGPMEWNGKGFKQDIQGYECRMSPSISYASTYYGSANDKCTLRIISLDLDFLEEIQAWMERYTKGQLYGGFSRNAIRSTDYSNEGRYSWSISCAQNKQGMAAKAELIQKFFRPDKSRRGKTPEEEKAIVLAAIEEGKAAHQRKKENMRYTISENLENDCVYAYAAKEFWVYDKQACRWYTSEFCREQYERVKQKLPHLTPEDFLTDSNDYSLLDDYELPSAALNALQEAVKSGKREVAPFEGAASASVDAQRKDEDADDRGIMTDVGELFLNGSECRRYVARRARTEMGKVQAIHVCDDQPEGTQIWMNASCPGEYWVLLEAGKIEGEHVESCPYCAALLGIGCGDVLLVPFGAELKSNKLPKIPEENNEPACSCAGCERKDCTCAGGRNAVGRADCTGEQNCAQSGCTYAAKHRANPTPADADASPCAPGASDVPPSPSQSAAADVQQGGGDDTANPTFSAAATAVAGTTADGPERSDSDDMTEVSAAESCGPADLAASTAADADLPEVCRGCQCVTCENKDCATPCWMDPKEVDECERLGVAGDDCEDYQPKEDTQCLKKPAPNGDAAANAAGNAAQEPQPEETPITPTNASSSSAPASLADAGAATQNLSAADAASLAADPAPKFDYSGMDIATVDTLRWAERAIRDARRKCIADVAEAVYIVHDQLVRSSDGHNLSDAEGVVRISDNSKHGNRGEQAFVNWCRFMGISKTTAYQLLQVHNLLSGATPEELRVLENSGTSLLYVASRPSAEPEAVEALKREKVKTLKEFRALEAQIKAEREAREQAERQLADAQREHQAERESTSALLRDEQQRRQKAEEGRIAAQSKAARYAEMKDAALETLKNEREKIRAAQSGQAQQLADAKKQWQAAADREKQAAVDAAIEQARTDARASAAVDVLFDQLENTVAALQAALETLEEMDIDKAGKLRRSLVRLLQTLAAQMGVG